MPEKLSAARRELLIMFLPMMINTLKPESQERESLEEKLEVIKNNKVPFDEKCLEDIVVFRKSSSLIFREKVLEKSFKRLVLELKFDKDMTPPFSNKGKNVIGAGERIGVCSLETVPGTIVDYKNMLLVRFKSCEGNKTYWEILAHFAPAIYSRPVDDCETDENKLFSMVINEQANPAVPTRRGIVRPRAEEGQQQEFHLPPRPQPQPLIVNPVIPEILENRAIENHQEFDFQENPIQDFEIDSSFNLFPDEPPSYIFGLFPLGDEGLNYPIFQYEY